MDVDQTVVISFSDVGADKCREKINNAYEIIMAEADGSDFDDYQEGQNSEIEATVEEFLNAYFDVTFLYGNKDFTQYTIAAVDNLPADRSFDLGSKTVTVDELMENIEYLREKAQYWKNARSGQGILRDGFETSFNFESIEEKDAYAFVKLSAGCSFYYEGQSGLSGMGHSFEIELLRIDSVWYIIDVYELNDWYDAENKGRSHDEQSDNAPPEGMSGELIYPMAIPFGKSAELDLDGDGIKEEVCQTLNKEGYRIESFTINGVEYIDLVAGIADTEGLGILSNARVDSWYIADVLTSDQNLELMIFDGGPSGDPATMFFDYVGGELIYLGYVPAYVNEIAFTGDGYFTANARLDVFQTWFAAHKWSIFGENRSIKEEPLVFYYVDFRFKDYVIGEEYFPSSETSTLLRDVKVFAEMDTESELRLLMKGEEIRILGTDNKEWVLIESGNERYYIHIKGTSIEVPGGEFIPAWEILHGLHYYD